ncbi:phosphotransferase [Paenibacillus sp. CAU 1782]
MSIRRFTYVKINNYYYCIDTGKWKMFRYLMNKFKPLALVDETARYTLMPDSLAKSYRVIKLLLYMHRGTKKNKLSTIKLPVYGQVALFKKNDNAYMVFDAEREVVTTFQAGPSKEMKTGKVSYLRKIGQSGIGPRIVEENQKEGWYEEEYLNTSHEPPEKLEQSERLQTEIMGFIGRVISQFPIKTVPLTHYVTKLTAKVPDNMMEDERYAPKIELILSFMATLRESLSRAEEQNIDLAFSHGDLHLKNLIRRDGRLIGIDWEFMKWRSLLYDAYYFYNFVRKEPDASALLHELETSKELELSPINPDTYRMVFQLEWIVHWLVIVGDRLERIKPVRMHHILDNLIQSTTLFFEGVEKR